MIRGLIAFANSSPQVGRIVVETAKSICRIDARKPFGEVTGKALRREGRTELRQRVCKLVVVEGRKESRLAP